MNKEFADRIIADNQKVYETIAEQFSQTRHFNWPDFQDFLEYIKAGDKVLDAGCGNGRFLELLKNKPVEYWGIDSSPKLVGLAKQKFPNQRFQTASILALPYPDQTFDVVLCLATLHHIPSDIYRHQAMRELARVLKKDGLLILLNWNLWQVGWWRGQLRICLKKIFQGLPLDFGDVFKYWKNSDGEIIGKRYLHGFTFWELKKLAESSGLQTLRQYATKKGQKTSWLFGHNLVSIFKRF
ncbi:class I SAM-dependent methyltransferase [Candidatus Parcubacteria bacterium]|jgi:ubiquinone/menaquinone biosynthesis C-methylase UbiE|nr:MAG: class I SAM-dependent methyltransferase [Candidatus Parcubacteria bacterium]